MNKHLMHRWIPLFLLGTALIIVYKTIDNLSGIGTQLAIFGMLLRPFVVGGIFAFLLYLPSSKLERFIRSRNKKFFGKNAHLLAVGVTMVGFLVLLVAAFSVFLPMLYQNIEAFVAQVPAFVTDLKVTLQAMSTTYTWIDNIDLDGLAASASVGHFINWVGLDNVNTYTKGIQTALSVVIDTLLGLVVAVYILIDEVRLKVGLRQGMMALVPTRVVAGFFRICSRVSKVVYSFLYGQSLDALFVGVCCAIAFTIMQLPNAAVMALIFGICSLVPFFGAFIGAGVVTLFTLISVGWLKAVVVLAFILVLQQIDANIVNPRIIGSSLGIRPLAVIFGVTIGGGLFGLPGMLLGAPFMAIVGQFFQEFAEQREKPLFAVMSPEQLVAEEKTEKLEKKKK